jgi:hypothetical protein
MSIIKKHLGLVLGLTLTAVLSVGAILLVKDKPDPRAAFKKRPPLLLSSFTTGGSAQKVLNVEVKYDEVQFNSDVAEIKAYVTLPFSYQHPLKYKWKLGQGVELVEGSVEGTVSELFAQQTHLISIKVKGFSKQENHHVGFEIFGQTQGRGIYGDALVASDLENTFENTVQNVERLKASE